MSEEIVDINEALERVQNDKELLVELFDIYQEDFVTKRKDLEKAHESKSAEDLRNIAHSMKGASSNISAKKIYTTLSNLEQMAEKNDLSKIDETIRMVDDQYAELKENLQRIKGELA